MESKRELLLLNLCAEEADKLSQVAAPEIRFDGWPWRWGAHGACFLTLCGHVIGLAHAP